MPPPTITIRMYGPLHYHRIQEFYDNVKDRYPAPRMIGARRFTR
ncbi:hypothetical protein TREPR_3244 [Treponema primitia ZAS-2]|uniref:Uncharacterized protein n=1 Tax=Treponema primitia (strain ATCC BAA-887 / DSM 12427 / ZAS-2) TaxID=545694 RepID=F5YKX3_TREPZ|nr:hypothetical protein TREPR_3244 [Treponema primitia ZAS-2]